VSALFDLVHHFGYAGLFLVMAIANMGMPVGTEIVVPAAGALAAQGHLSSWVLVGAVATAGEVVGGFVLYLVGYYGGEPFVQRYGRYVLFRERELARVHAFYQRYGRNTVFMCRFVPFVRGVAALPAGISRMPKGVFVLYTAAGSAVFCFGLAWLGNAFAANIGAMLPLIHRFSIAIVIAGIAAIAAAVWWRVNRRGSA
jgi:membrane protein DedA with SNARE-associated domain